MAQPVTKFVQQMQKQPEQLAPRRINHGSVAWSVAVADKLRQPQDGSLKKALRIADIGARMQRAMPGSVPLPGSALEPEDARLTGGTRSLMRRLMGLNIARKLPLVPTTAAKRLA